VAAVGFLLQAPFEYRIRGLESAYEKSQADRPHLARYAVFFLIMMVLCFVDLRVWFALAYPIYGIAFLLLIAVDLVGRHALGAQRWLQIGPLRFQPSEVMKIGLVLALARFYHGLSADRARLSWWLLIPAAIA